MKLRFPCICVSSSPDWDSVDDKTGQFNFDGEEKICKVVKVYDGDTIHVVFLFNKQMTRWTVRMTGYDSPEMKSKNKDEKVAALAARDYLSSEIQEKIVILKCGKFDKYGRLLGTIIHDRQNMNEKMISLGHGYVYDGGTKKKLFN